MDGAPTTGVEVVRGDALDFLSQLELDFSGGENEKFRGGPVLDYQGSFVGTGEDSLETIKVGTDSLIGCPESELHLSLFGSEGLSLEGGEGSGSGL